MPTKSNTKGAMNKGSAKHLASKETPINSNPKSELKSRESQPLQANSITGASLDSGSPHTSQEAEKLADLQPKSSAMESRDDNIVRETPVNRKKQKRRDKEAAKRAAEQQNLRSVKGEGSLKESGHMNGHHYAISDDEDAELYDPDDVDEHYFGEEAGQSNYHESYEPARSQLNGNGNLGNNQQEIEGGSLGKSKKKRSSTSGADSQPPLQDSLSRAPPPPLRHGQSYRASGSQNSRQVSKDRIWNTSTAEERERIKEFWLSLGEDDRRSLVKVEKEAVLKKMKEQQKHSCSCTVCGRKRTAIEEELEVLYDAYYEELEQYANNQQINMEDGTPTIPNPRMYSHSMSRQSFARQTNAYDRRSSSARIREIEGEAVLEDEEDSEVGDDDDLSDEYIEPEPEPTPAAADFFNFGNSLTVQGGILTVADDLLKNDGKKFIEMMEQLAERRMQREEDAQFASSAMQHNHSSAMDEEMYDEDDEEEEEYDSQEDEDYEEDEMESMTEEQRMEEGRRMFQIFAARMFEQRVLTAYREKVALERQQKLIEELDDESRVDAQREAKKAKEAQKKKEKKRMQKQAKDEEKAKREAEKAAEEAAIRALEEKKAEDMRLKKEEQRKKREAEKKSQDEERARKESEKQRRLQEAREAQAELEKKQREQKERERKKKEEAKRKDRDEREAKEKEVKEKRDREIAEKKERGAKSASAQTQKEQAHQEELSSAKSNAGLAPVQSKKQPPTTTPTTVAASPGLHPPATTSSHTSPHLAIATPVIPKAPTPVRTRQTSFQDSRATSPRNYLSSGVPTASPSTSLAQNHGQHNVQTTRGKQATPPQPIQSQVGYSPKNASPGVKMGPPGFPSMPSTSNAGFVPTTFGPNISEVITPFPSDSQHGSTGVVVGGHRNAFIPPGGGSFAPNSSEGPRFLPGRGKMEPPPPPLQQPVAARPTASFVEASQHGIARDNKAPPSHSRNTSTSSNFATQAQPIARPAPIQRPSSTTPQQQAGNASPPNKDVEDLADHLGSKALIDDDDDTPLTASHEDSRRGSIAVGGHRNVRTGFGAPPGLPDPIGTIRHESSVRGMPPGVGNTWANQQAPFSNPTSPWMSSGGFGRSNPGQGFAPFGSMGQLSQAASRAVTMRTIIAQTCQKMSPRSAIGPVTGWQRADELLREVQLARPAHLSPIGLDELLDLCEAAGNHQNGGGAFELFSDPSGIHVRFDQTRSGSLGPVPGEIGSPIGGGPSVFGGPSRPFHPSGGYPPSAGF